MSHDELTNRITQQRNFDIHAELHTVPPHAVYEGKYNDHRAVLKVDTDPTGRAGIEGAVMALVNESTDLPVPRVLERGEEYYIAEWHPEARPPEDGQEPDADWAEPTGRALARLHRESSSAVDGFGLFHLDGETVTVDSHETFHEAALAYLSAKRPIIETFGHEDMVDTAEQALHRHPDAFEGAGPPAICHGWATPEHVTISDGSVACILDFEHAIVAPGEFDIWRTAIPAFANRDDEALDAFLEGYESVRPLPPGVSSRKPAFVLLNQIYYFESLYGQNHHGPKETADRATWLRDAIEDTVEALESNA